MDEFLNPGYVAYFFISPMFRKHLNSLQSLFFFNFVVEPFTMRHGGIFVSTNGENAAMIPKSCGSTFCANLEVDQEIISPVSLFSWTTI